MSVPRLTTLAASAALAAIVLILVASGGKSALAITSSDNGNFEKGDLSGWTVDTTNGGTANAVTSYDYWYYRACEWWESYGGPCGDTGTMRPHEGSYFALLRSGNPPYTKISQPFKASTGEKISGWAFFDTDNWGYYDDKAQVVIKSASGTTIGTPFEESLSSVGDWLGSTGNSGWKYWEQTIPAGTENGDFQVEARVATVSYNGIYNPGQSFIGLDDVKTATLGPDTTKPSTSATRSPEPNEAGWNKDNATVTLKATDNEGGWGVEKITYSASGAQTIAQTDATGDSVKALKIPFDHEGTSTLTYYSTDNAGNKEDPKTLTVKVDKTAPSVKSTSPASNAAIRVSTSAKISATFSDVSGMDPDTLNDDTFFVYTMNKWGTAITGQATGTISYDETSKTVTFTPSTPLAKGTLYWVRLSAGCCPIEDKAGNPMAKSYDWKFSTGGSL